MIKITRAECPVRLREGGNIDNKACKREVVRTLHNIMQYGKCCYCEKEIPESGDGQALEHFRPKAPSMFPQLRNTWSNLLHSCPDCNGKKRKQFPTDANGNPLIIDPSDPDIDPEDHLDFCVDLDDDINFGRVRPKDDSELGWQTIETIGLDSAFRRYERTSGYKELYSAYIDIRRAHNTISKQQKIQAFEGLLGADKEYAAFARAFARKKGLEGRGVRIPVGAET